MSDISKEDLEAIKRAIQAMRMEKKEKADLFSVTSINAGPSPQGDLSHQPDVTVEELYLAPNEPEHTPSQDQITVAQTHLPGQSEQDKGESTPPSVV